MSVEFSIPMQRGKVAVHAVLYKAANGTFGLTLHDGNGNPMGHGRMLSTGGAAKLAKAVQTVKPAWLPGLIWAALGYESKLRKPVASAACHPGAFRVNGRI